MLRVLVIAPIWYPAKYHPHTRRIKQWLNALRENSAYITVISLSSKYYRSKSKEYEVILGVHPRFDKYGLLSIKKNSNTRRAIVRLLKSMVQNYMYNHGVDVCVVSHPAILTAMNGIFNNNSIILDIPDCPKCEGDIKEWGYRDSIEFRETVYGCRLVAISEPDKDRIGSLLASNYMRRDGLDLTLA